MTLMQSVRQRIWRRLGGSGALSPLAEAPLYGDHNQAKRASDMALGIARSLATAAAQQRNALDTAADEVRLLIARGQELRTTVERVKESLERAKLVALNAALEGAHLGEPMGKAVVVMAEEVRTLAARGLEALGEHTESLQTMVVGRDRLQEQITQVRQQATTLGEELLRIESAQAELAAALGVLGHRIETSTGTDSGTVQVLTQAAEHARGLLDALTALSTKHQVGFVLRMLGPTLAPLLRWLEQGQSLRGDGA